MDPASIIFLHLQKTGGTSLRDVIRDVYGHNPPETYTVSGTNGRKHFGNWRTLTSEQLGADAWHDHMSFGLHKLLPQPAPYFTIVRDPVARAVSRFCHTPTYRKNGQTPASVYHPAWGMVYQLSGVPQNKLDRLSEEHAERALKNLQKHFLYVGDTTRMGELGLWLRDELGWDIELPLPHVNKAKPEIEVSEKEIEELREIRDVKLDQMLYDQICELGPYPQEWVL